MLLSVRLTPRAASDRVDRIAPGAEGWRIEARVRAVPEKGLANEALIRLLADTLGVPKSALSLNFGSKGREKRVRVEGDGASLENALRAHACFRPSGDA
ncbi:DUF167 domain-containing protein [Aureimonas ureilytica]|uniref:DUF167 domain-containing protein n=1 Tax=Aureimonas ureilytica TaxID=401562 RepID=UPI0003696E83|nr:DUF167 family protein [Aureimonas ureilytica]